MIKRGLESVVRAFKVVMKATVVFAVLVPILSFWFAAMQLFQSPYYQSLMEMREFAINFFLMDLIVGFRQAVFGTVLVCVIGSVVYWFYTAQSKE